MLVFGGVIIMMAISQNPYAKGHNNSSEDGENCLGLPIWSHTNIAQNPGPTERPLNLSI